MNNQINSEAKKYIKEIKNLIPNFYENKSTTIDHISIAISDYLEEHPEAGIDDIYLEFGKPEDIAESFFAVQDSDYIKNCMKPDKTKKFLIISILLLVLAVIFVIILYFYSIDLGNDVTAVVSDIDETQVTSVLPPA